MDPKQHNELLIVLARIADALEDANDLSLRGIEDVTEQLIDDVAELRRELDEVHLSLDAIEGDDLGLSSSQYFLEDSGYLDDEVIEEIVPMARASHAEIEPDNGPVRTTCGQPRDDDGEKPSFTPTDQHDAWHQSQREYMERTGTTPAPTEQSEDEAFGRAMQDLSGTPKSDCGCRQ